MAGQNHGAETSTAQRRALAGIHLEATTGSTLTAIQPLQGRIGSAMRNPRVARSSQPWAGCFTSFQDGSGVKVHSAFWGTVSPNCWFECFTSVQGGSGVRVHSAFWVTVRPHG